MLGFPTMIGLKKVGTKLLGLLGMFPQLCIVGAFTGSMVLKVAPLLGLAPKPLEQEVFASYGLFIRLPLLHPITSTLGMSAQNMMLALAVTHIVAVALLLLPSGSQPAKVAGIWAMIAMAGAEYCTRSADVAPPMTPPEFKWQAQVLGSITHVFLFLCGAYCVARTSSLGLGSFVLGVLGLKPKAKDRCKDSKDSKDSRKEEANLKDAKSSAKKADVVDTSKDAHKEASRKRTATPPPKAKKTK